MAVATETGQRSAPPDILGPTAPLPVATLVMGSLALALILLGTVGAEIYANIRGGPITAACRAAGLSHYVPPPNPALPGKGIQGAEGICTIVTTARSTVETTIIVAALILGAVAIAVGFSTYGRMDTRRKRRHALTGAILGIQAVALAAFVLWTRSGHGMLSFVKNELNF